ncbi:6811_t:CDS:2, partial [Acaulospora colombiana]
RKEQMPIVTRLRRNVDGFQAVSHQLDLKEGKSTVFCRDEIEDVEADLLKVDIPECRVMYCFKFKEGCRLGPHKSQPDPQTMPPTAKSRSRQVVDKLVDNSEDSDAENDDTVLGEKPTELFVDPLHGNPLICYVHDDVDDRSAIIRIIQ